MSNFSLEQLTEGIRQRHLGSQNRQLTEKWARTGLLRGLEGTGRENMARLLENQASQVLREASSLGNGGNAALASSGDMRGFTNVAFPIVRRVFGGLIANDLVSIQPMSLPSGLLFYLDYTSGDNHGAEGSGNVASKGESLYNGPAGAGVRTGSTATGGKYDLGGLAQSRNMRVKRGIDLAGNDAATNPESRAFFVTTLGVTTPHLNTEDLSAVDMKLSHANAQKFAQFDAAAIADSDAGQEFTFLLIPLTSTNFADFDTTMVKEVALVDNAAGDAAALAHLEAVDPAKQTGTGAVNLKRLNRLVKVTGSHGGGALNAAAIDAMVDTPLANVGDTDVCLLAVCHNSGADFPVAATAEAMLSIVYPVASKLAAEDGSSIVVPSFESNMDAADPQPSIPEIDIKVEAVPVVAETRKLRARWSPELAQDLNAYHSLDAEVELTQILSEQIALEIDREILNDLLTGASAANFFWSRAPGKFVNKETAADESDKASFTGTVREWYETLVETIIDAANQIHRKTLRGSANFIVCGPDVATILEASVLYKPSYTLDGDGQVSQPMVIGADRAGTLSNRFTVYKDPYFPRNKILVGYKGGSYLETGFVYAPYVPLIVTPTIFQPEDFTPRKGVMTRYGKKMVRADFYGTVTCLDMNII